MISVCISSLGNITLFSEKVVSVSLCNKNLNLFLNRILCIGFILHPLPCRKEEEERRRREEEERERLQKEEEKRRREEEGRMRREEEERRRLEEERLRSEQQK